MLPYDRSDPANYFELEPDVLRDPRSPVAWERAAFMARDAYMNGRAFQNMGSLLENVRGVGR